jgi:hypothetical protein
VILLFFLALAEFGLDDFQLISYFNIRFPAAKVESWSGAVKKVSALARLEKDLGPAGPVALICKSELSKPIPAALAAASDPRDLAERSENRENFIATITCAFD